MVNYLCKLVKVGVLGLNTVEHPPILPSLQTTHHYWHTPSDCDAEKDAKQQSGEPWNPK